MTRELPQGGRTYIGRQTRQRATSLGRGYANCNRGLAFVMVTEVYKADGVLDLFNRDTIDQFDFGLRTNVNTLQRGKRTGNIFNAAIAFDLGRNQHAPVC